MKDLEKNKEIKNKISKSKTKKSNIIPKNWRLILEDLLDRGTKPHSKDLFLFFNSSFEDNNNKETSKRKRIKTRETHQKANTKKHLSLDKRVLSNN